MPGVMLPSWFCCTGAKLGKAGMVPRSNSGLAASATSAFAHWTWTLRAPFLMDTVDAESSQEASVPGVLVSPTNTTDEIQLANFPAGVD